MSYLAVGYGNFVTGVNNVTLAPVKPAGVVSGNLLLMHTGTYLGTVTPPVVSGWTLLVSQVSCSLYGRIAVGSGDSTSINWNGNGTSNAYAMVAAYSGNWNDINTIVSSSIVKTSNSTANLTYSPLVVTPKNCLVVAAGCKNKTSTSDGATYGQIIGDGFTLQKTSVPAGTNPMAAYNDWIQTTATDTLNSAQTSSIADSTAQSATGYTVALLVSDILQAQICI